MIIPFPPIRKCCPFKPYKFTSVFSLAPIVVEYKKTGDFSVFSSPFMVNVLLLPSSFPSIVLVTLSFLISPCTLLDLSLKILTLS